MLRRLLSSSSSSAAAAAAAAAPPPLRYSDGFVRRVLQDTKVVAMVGASANPTRPSYFAAKYMQSKGFRVIPVNPVAAGSTILGETVYADLDDIPSDVQVDMVDVFRNSEAALDITRESIQIGAKTVWMQLSVRNDEAAAEAEAAGLNVVMDRATASFR